MRNKRARQIRQLLEIEARGEEYREREWEPIKVGYYGIIDGLEGNHRIEERMQYRLRRNPSRIVYNQLKKIYKQRHPEDIYEQLMDDLKLMGGTNE